MKLIDQVITRDQARQLKELGIDQAESYFFINPAGEVLEVWMLEGMEDDFCAAFTVAELGIMLLVYMPIGHAFNPMGDEWFHTWQNTNYESQPVVGPYSTEAQTRAAMLIYLLENNLVKIEEVNQRLKQ